MTAIFQGVVRARWFQRTITAVILLAGVLAGLETSAALRERHGPLFLGLDTLVLAVFIAEMLVKLAAHGRRPWDYFRDGWNVFDFAIVVLCCLPMDTQFASVLRLARGLRVLRLITALPRLQMLVGALLRSLGAMGYVGLLLALMFYIYGVAGVHLFGALDEVHFGTLISALLSLFRVLTLDNWGDIFQGAYTTAPATAVVYFVSFILLGTMIMLNLFIGIIMNSMSEMHREMEERDRRQELENDPGTVEADLRQLESQMDALRAQLSRTRQRLAQTPPTATPAPLHD